jgi:hypothetical protein
MRPGHERYGGSYAGRERAIGGIRQSSAQALLHDLSIFQEPDACTILPLPPDLAWKGAQAVDHQDDSGIDVETLMDSDPGATRRDMKHRTFQNPALAVQSGTPQHWLPFGRSLFHRIFHSTTDFARNCLES